MHRLRARVPVQAPQVRARAQEPVRVPSQEEVVAVEAAVEVEVEAVVQGWALGSALAVAQGAALALELVQWSC